MAAVKDETLAQLRDFIEDPPELRSHSPGRIEFDRGLSNHEFDDIEWTFGFTFPPDLRAFLALGLPVSRGFVNWRSVDHAEILSRLAWPADGLCFDVEHNAYWQLAWGPRPFDLEEAFTVARRHVAQAPTLVPIYSHRYIPDEPAHEGNPVFSVHQTDVIHYGDNLTSYLENEFRLAASRGARSLSRSPRQIRFWTRLTEMDRGVTAPDR